MKAGQLSSKEHRTQAASEKANDLWCYQCFTMDNDDKCINLTDNTGNSSTFRQKCWDDKRMCMVRPYCVIRSDQFCFNFSAIYLALNMAVRFSRLY